MLGLICGETLLSWFLWHASVPILCVVLIKMELRFLLSLFIESLLILVLHSL